jgi:hypothetical protein
VTQGKAARTIPSNTLFVSAATADDETMNFNDVSRVGATVGVRHPGFHFRRILYGRFSACSRRSPNTRFPPN